MDMADVVLSDEDPSLKELLESASSVLTACHNISTKHQPNMKKVTRHKKKTIHTVSKEAKGSKKGMPLRINQLDLDWTEDEDDEDDCNIENIPPVNPRGSKRQALKPLHKMISFSSDSDSSGSDQQTCGEKGAFEQRHQHFTEGRTILKEQQTNMSSAEVFMELDARSTTNIVKGNRAKCINKTSETRENTAGASEYGTRQKEKDSEVENNHNLARIKDRAACKPLGSFRKHNAELHALFDSSESSSESEVASASVPRLTSGAISDSDSEDLSRKLEQILSISTSRRMVRKKKKTKEDTTSAQVNASLANESGLGCFRDQHPTSSKQMNVGENAKKCSGSLDPRSSKLHDGLDETLSPVGADDGTDGSGMNDVSLTSDILPEMREISLQVSLSSNSRTSPETSIEGPLWSNTLSTQDKLTERQEVNASSGVTVCSKDAAKEDFSCSVVAHVEATSQHLSLHSRDSSCTDGVGTDFINKELEPCTRDLSLQVSLGSTDFSDSDLSENKSLPESDLTDCNKHLPSVQNFSLQVSMTSSATDSSQMSFESVENEQGTIIDDNGECVPSSNSENSSLHQGHIMSCDSGAKLKKKLFPRWTKKRNMSSSLPWDSGIGATSGKHADRKQAANTSEGASYIDLCVDEADKQERALSPDEGSHVTSVGSAKVKDDEGLDDDWLPDLDSSSEEDDLEAFFQVMRTPKVKKPLKDLPSMDVFIVNDSDVSSDDDSALYVTAVGSPQKNSSSSGRSGVDSVFVTPSVPPIRRKAKTTVKKSVSSRHHDLGTVVTMVTVDRVDPMRRPNSTGHQRVGEANFLRSLDQNMDNGRRHPEAARYVKHFKKLKEELTAHMFKLYNKTVFAHKLPEDMSITWNKRLNKTAGFCTYSKRVATPADRKVRIELSVKVCDSAERVRDTLIHELCHAAVWFLNGVNDGHGPHWKYWAHAACRAHPELPAIERCHKYEISHKYTYKCTKCGYEIGRHSKSLDTKAKVCGYCHSPFSLITKGATTPRTPNKFALFVKDNYGSVKRDNRDVTHKDVMRILSSDFARQNSISASGGQKEL